MGAKKCAAVAFMAAVMSGCGGEDDGLHYSCENETRTGVAFILENSVRVELSEKEYGKKKGYDGYHRKDIYSEAIKPQSAEERESSFALAKYLANLHCASGIAP